MMIEIGDNLQYERFQFEELTNSVLKVRNASQQTEKIDVATIRAVEVVGVKSNSGYSGTMEWGMSNPTFILPTNLFYNIINLFKRNNDIIHIKVSLKGGGEFIVLGNKDNYKNLQKLIIQ